MPIEWDNGTAITGEGAVTPGADYVRVELDTIPDYLGRLDSVPPRFGFLGTVGAVIGDYRSRGVPVTYANQQIIMDVPANTGVYYILANGVSGTLYRGVGSMVDNQPSIAIYRNSDQSIPNITVTPLEFDTTLSDPWGMHDPGTNPSRITVPVAGWYQVSTTVRWGASSTGRRDVVLRVNGADWIASTGHMGSGVSAYPPIGFSPLVYLNAGDYVEIVLYQNSGGALLAIYNPEESLAFRMVRVA